MNSAREHEQRRRPAPAADRGDPLPAESAESFGRAMNADFSDVRIHTDARSTQDLGAVAYTSGADVVFRPGSYSPGTPAGDRLLAHELAHVVQQSSGLVPAGVDGGSRDPLERQADQLARPAADGSRGPANTARTPIRAQSSGAIQRQQVKPGVPVKETREQEMEKTLSSAGLADLKTWLGGVRTVNFLDAEAFDARPELGDRLDRVAARLKGETPPPGGWVKGSVSAVRPPGSDLHGFGLAVDFRMRASPYIFASKQPSADDKGGQDDFVRGVIDRAVRLVLGRSAAAEAFDQRPALPAATATAPDPYVARARASLDKLREASDAYVTYLGLGDPAKRATLERLTAALRATDSTAPDADQWVAAIAADRARLVTVGRSKDWDWSGGFSVFDPRLIEAMAAEGLNWLGDNTIGGGRDIMHFDTRRVGPITRIWKDGAWTNLGSG